LTLGMVRTQPETPADMKGKSLKQLYAWIKTFWRRASRRRFRKSLTPFIAKRGAYMPSTDRRVRAQ